MTAEAAISFSAPWGVAAGLVLVCTACLVAWFRGLRLGRTIVSLGVVGAILLACAAGLPAWNRPAEKWVAVMVDVSASTRGAVYRDRIALEKRIATLLGNVPHRVRYFAEGFAEPQVSGDVLTDVASDKTVFPIAPGAAAVLLFSDCRFDLPRQIVPTYVVIDPALEEVDDARVTSLQLRGNQVAAAVTNGGNTRGLSWRGTTGGSTRLVPSGTVVLSKNIASGAPRVGVELAAGDAWPENDTLLSTVPPPQALERWWVGSGPAPSGWRAMVGGDLPVELGDYLAAGVIVLDDVPAGQLSDAQQQRLSQYVHHTGGALVILGGAHAFGAGGYAGTPLEALSPLSSRPPEPTVHWVVLVDQSGSMGSPVDGGSRWDYAKKAVKAVVAALPPEDVASVGGFSEGVEWWVQARRAMQLAAIPLPPANAYPHGPTNLEPALEAIARVGGTMPVQLLVISDFDAKIDHPAALTTSFKSKGAHVYALGIGEGSALKTMQEIATGTGGASMTELDPTRWTSAARELLRASLPDLVRRDAVRVNYSGALGNVPAETISSWNRTWAKQGSATLAEASDNSYAVPMAASWNLGEGRVVAAAFEPGAGTVEAMAKLVERKPHDPRFTVKWEAGAKLRVAVDAVGQRKFLNDLKVAVELADETANGAAREVTAMGQTGPGKYEAEVPAPRSSRLATVRVDGQVVERFAVAGRYAPEFEAVGNDHAAMEELARLSGGRVIGPGEDQAIRIDWPVERVGLVPEFGIAGAALLLGALWRWRTS